jgi:hypothetical protein
MWVAWRVPLGWLPYSVFLRMISGKMMSDIDRYATLPSHEERVQGFQIS